jgi:hypothetical protein
MGGGEKEDKMPTLRDEAVRRGLVERLGRLTPETKPRWGSLSAPRMVCHLSDSLDSGLGVFPVPLSGPWVLRHFPLKQLALYVAPFPKGAKGPEELMRTAPGDFERDRAGVVERMERMAAAPRGPGPQHPLFGPVNHEEWNAIHWKHIDHHLRQFGC